MDKPTDPSEAGASVVQAPGESSADESKPSVVVQAQGERSASESNPPVVDFREQETVQLPHGSAAERPAPGSSAAERQKPVRPPPAARQVAGEISVKIPPAFRDMVLSLHTVDVDAVESANISIAPEKRLLEYEALIERIREIPTEGIAVDGRLAGFTEDGEITMGGELKGAHYEIQGLLGKGGMGVVCLARQQSLGREVALKVGKQWSGNPSAQSRMELFTNEAHITAAMDHPNVVPVYTLAKDRTGRVFFTMKRVRGMGWNTLIAPELIEDLEERKKSLAVAVDMTLEDHLDILISVCDAVGYAHSKEILHRDLKPENVMIGEYGEVLLMDFGLAMPFGSKNPYVLDPERKPLLVGTPSQLAPEMARGEMTRFCAATDVYLLGGVLYRLLTGRNPHYAGEMLTSIYKAAQGHVDPPEEVSDSPDINPEISRIVMKALAPEIEDRYQSAREFQEDLRRYKSDVKSMAVARDAGRMLQEVRSRFAGGSLNRPDFERLDKDQSAVAYGQLSECIGAFRQAINLWPENRPAQQGLMAALTAQIELALANRDLTLAASHIEMMGEGCGSSDDRNWADVVDKRRERLSEELKVKQREQSGIERRARLQRWLALAVILLLAAGIAVVVVLLGRQRKLALANLKVTREQKRLAQENLRNTECMKKRMFAQAVSARAALLRQYMRGLEAVVAQYSLEASRLTALPKAVIPARAMTRAGREGYYLDKDYYDSRTRPPDVRRSKTYGFDLSFTQATTVLAPWAKKSGNREYALAHAKRLVPLSTLFSHVHRSRKDILWSLLGTKRGVMISFPGSGRFRDKPTYDPTKRPWFTAVVGARDCTPQWVNPHIDAAGQGLIIACVSPIKLGKRHVGAVGLEVSVRNFQEKLLEFTRAAGRGARALLVRPDGRVLVDTWYETDSKTWKQKFQGISVRSAGPHIHAYYQDVMVRKADSSTSIEVETPHGKKLLAHARLADSEWVLILEVERGALLERGRGRVVKSSLWK